MRLGLVLLIVCIAPGLCAQKLQWLDEDYAPSSDSVNASYFYDPSRVRTVYSDPDSINIFVIHYASGPYHQIGGFENGPDSKKWGRHVRYHENGNKAEQGIYLNDQKRGLWQSWYPDGSMHYEIELSGRHHYKALEFIDSTGVYRTSQGQGWFKLCENGYCESGMIRDSVKVGEWQISKNGQLTHKELYSNGELVQGAWITKKSPVTYQQIATVPRYADGGIQGFYSFIASEMNYPKSALRDGVEGKVYVQFTVNSDGTVDGIEILQSTHPEFSAEALRVMSRVKNWEPGKLRGKPVSQKIVTPLVFLAD